MWKAMSDRRLTCLLWWLRCLQTSYRDPEWLLLNGDDGPPSFPLVSPVVLSRVAVPSLDSEHSAIFSSLSDTLASGRSCAAHATVKPCYYAGTILEFVWLAVISLSMFNASPQVRSTVCTGINVWGFLWLPLQLLLQGNPELGLGWSADLDWMSGYCKHGSIDCCTRVPSHFRTQSMCPDHILLVWVNKPAFMYCHLAYSTVEEVKVMDWCAFLTQCFVCT